MGKTRMVRLGELSFFQSSFKISSDNVLFFDFVKLPKAGRVFELGAGFGLGAVILAKRYPETEIIAVEYQRDLFELLEKNLILNEVKNVKPILCDIREIERCFKSQEADAVYSNPPFWRKDFLKSFASKDEIYIKANYEVETPFTDFVKAAKYLLKSSKVFFFMFETPRLVEVLDTLRNFKFSPRRLRFVYPNRQKASHVFFVESVLGGKGGNLKVEQPTYSTAL